MAKQKLEKLDEAIQDLRQCVELDPTYQKGWSRLGSCLEQKGLKNEALDCYKRINDQEGIQRCSQQATGQNPFENLNKEELLKQFPQLGDAVNDPQVQELISKPEVRQKLEECKTNPMKILSMMNDPDLKPLFNVMMSKLGPQL